MRIVTIVLATCCLLSVTSCFGLGFFSGGFGNFLTPAPVPPQIAVVEPASIVSGQSASFLAGTFLGPTEGSYKWSFGGGVTPNSSKLNSPTVTALAPGTYSGVVIVADEAGKTTFPFTYTVTAP